MATNISKVSGVLFTQVGSAEPKSYFGATGKYLFSDDQSKVMFWIRSLETDDTLVVNFSDLTINGQTPTTVQNAKDLLTGLFQVANSSSGGTTTLQGALDAGSVLDKDNDIVTGGNDLTIDGKPIATVGYKVYTALLNDIIPTGQSFGSTLVVGELYSIVSIKKGLVYGLTLANGGTGYPDGWTTENATTGGTGTGLTLDIHATDGIIDDFGFGDNHGELYTLGDIITISGGGGNATFEATDIWTDDFSNVANVVSGTINENDCSFVATGTTPTSWSAGSELLGYGGILASPLLNTLGELSFEGFNIVSDGLFTENKTLPVIKNISTGLGFANVIHDINIGDIKGCLDIIWETESLLRLSLIKTDGSAGTGLLKDYPFKIEVYP